MQISDNLMTILLAVLASSGFWAFMQYLFNRKSLQSKMLLGLGHDRIVYLGIKYIERGWITHDEYENLNDYLYAPYEGMGGNGSAKRVMTQVRNLPFKPNGYKESKDK